MTIDINIHLDYRVPEPCMVLMQFEAADLVEQTVRDHHLELAGNPQIHRLEAGDGIGERTWVHAAGNLNCSYRATVEVSRPVVDLATVQATQLQHLPARVIRYLLPSRYCPINDFDGLSLPDFGQHQGGALIDVMARWICDNFTYDIGASDATTTAQQSFLQRRGVCRDYAHVLISLARSNGIPARYASVYSPDIDPMDFHAVVEVFLDGAWHLVDPTGMSQPQRTAIIGVGRDATDVAFLTSFGDMHLISQRVEVGLVDSQP